MSIRIHKMIGYGGRHPLSRTLSNQLYENDTEGEVEQLLEAAYNDAKEKGDDQSRRSLGFDLPYKREDYNKEERYPKYFNDLVKYADYPDNRGGNWLIMTPMMWKSWYRFNDDIDHMDYALTYGDIETRIQYPSGGIYPYLGYMDANTGKRLPHYIKRFDEIPEGVEPIPEVPYSIRIIAEHLCFPDWKKLRPMLITWWS